MSQIQLASTASDREIAFHTNTGFALKGGRFAIQVTDGNVAPQLHTEQPSERAATFRQTMRNTSDTPMAIESITMFDGKLELQGAGWRVMHPELFRCERLFEGYTYFTDGLLAPVADVQGEFGLSEDLPFPGMIFTHPERGTILMATLTQARSKPVWTISHDGQSTRINAVDYFTGIESIPVNPGETFETETWAVLATTDGIEDALQQYHALLHERHHFYGKDSILHNAVVWGSWNYNYRPRGHGDIDHDYIAKNAKALSTVLDQEAPDAPRFVMIDDGYQRGKSQETSGWFASCLEIFYDQPAHDPSLFPDGMKRMADDIRAAGARPALWISPRVHQHSQLAKDHPDWLVGFEDDRTYGKLTAFLDYSVPEAREYTRQAWKTVFQEWGFEGVKMDFWSMAFEIPSLRFRHQERTAVELRNLFLSDMREFVPAEGYIIACCAVNSGNPFVGQYVDATRCAMDVGDGDWGPLFNSAGVLSAVRPFFSHQSVLADTDSFGWHPQMAAGENRLWATMALMMGGMCEIAGDMTQQDETACDFLGRASRFFSAAPSQRTHTGLDTMGMRNGPAPHLVLERADGVYEAHLNWGRYPRLVELPAPVRNLWTGEWVEGRHQVPARDALWFKREG